MDSPIQADSQQFRQAFNFLKQHPASGDRYSSSPRDCLPEADVAFLRELDQTLTQRGITPPAKNPV
jgi:hypothetical protein